MSSATETVTTTAPARSGLGERVRALRTAQGATRDRSLFIVGGILIPLGLLLILFGWIGASRTPLLFEQVPYLISGGLLGLGFVFAGGFLYYAYWHTLAIRDARAQHVELTAALGRIEALLANGASPAAASAAPRTAEAQFVATRSGSLLHRPDCPVVAGRSGLRVVTASTGGLEPCRICDPFAG